MSRSDSPKEVSSEYSNEAFGNEDKEYSIGDGNSILDDLRSEIVQNKLNFDKQIRKINEEKQILISYNRRFKDFVNRLAKILDVNNDDLDEIMDLLIIQIKKLKTRSNFNVEMKTVSKSNTKSQESTDYVLKRQVALDSKIEELEEANIQSQHLISLQELELSKRKNENKKLSTTINNQQSEIASLSKALRKVLNAAGTRQNWEEAVDNINKMKEKLYLLEQQTQNRTVEDFLIEFQKSQSEKITYVQSQIDEQATLIESIFRSIENKSKSDPNVQMLERVCADLEEANTQLSQRMQELREENDNKRKMELHATRVRPKESTFHRQGNIASEKPREKCRKCVGTDLEQSIWMAKTKEMLAFERQIERVDQKITNAYNHAQYIVQEKLFSRNDGDGITAVCPSTLI